MQMRAKLINFYCWQKDNLRKLSCKATFTYCTL